MFKTRNVKIAECIALSAMITILLSQQPARAQPASPPICGGPLTCLDQGWTDQDRAWWYSVSQGSRLLPLAWMKALEQPGKRDKILADDNIVRLRYLPNRASALNPHGLPVGFVVDHEPGDRADLMCDVFPGACESRLMRQPWVGLNCSACHTTQFTHKDKDGRNWTVRVEGAPTLADFKGFTEQVLAALRETASSSEKFDRFAREVLGARMSVETRADLMEHLGEQIRWQTRLQEKNAATDYGFGRLDAQGHILNKVSLVLGASEPLLQFPADAPASYPHIWNAPQHKRVQWNGLAENAGQIPFFGRDTDLGALVRNTAEVIGVFAHIDVEKGRLYHRSSLRIENMVDIERRLGRLQSPRWPEHILGAIDWKKAGAGKPIFDANCAECHRPLAPTELRLPANEKMVKLSVSRPNELTDIWLACNAWLHKSKAGLLKDRRQAIIVKPRIEEVDSTRFMLANVALGAVLGRADELARRVLEDFFFGGQGLPPFLGADTLVYLPGVNLAAKKAQARQCLNSGDDVLAYKARPLNGIWATAPYLHNGSVPTLYHLLLPARLRTVTSSSDTSPVRALPLDKARPETFYVGSREFDADKVGLRWKDQDQDAFEFKVIDAAGVPILGNYNNGHEYGVDLTEEQRQMLLEYLKTL